MLCCPINNVLSQQRRFTPIRAEVVRPAGAGCYSLVFVPPGHQGIPRNEEADRLATNLAVVKNGIIYTPAGMCPGRT